MSAYKYCIVPLCANTSVTTPNKLFIRVPTDPAIRKKWCKVLKRDEQKSKMLSSTSPRCVCEDHFNLETDLENYTRFKIMGGNVKLKKGVLPHIFHCQKQNSTVNCRTTGERRRRLQVIDEMMKEEQPSSSIEKPVETLSEEVPRIDSTLSTSCTDVPLTACKAVQVKLSKNFRSQGTNTVSLYKGKNVTSTACSPIKQFKESHQRYLQTKKFVDTITECSDKEDSDDSDYTIDYAESESDYGGEKYSSNIRKEIISLIEKNPLLYLGVPQQTYFLIGLLSESIHSPTLNVLICLKKIRLNLSYELLGNQFGLSPSTVCRLFKKTIPLLSSMLHNFIVWPSQGLIKSKLPVAFRARYQNVVSIIDCFEIEIQKPGNPVHQALTWSDYKNCNTLKYLISCTPDGLVNFVSCGFGGRTTDSIIAQESGFLEYIKPGMMVMADRGFKNISHILEERGAKLVRPSSVHKDTILTREEVLDSKKIAALRIHVERVIRRIREYDILKMHSMIDRQLLTAVDHMVYIVCGLINVQSPLIK